MFAVFFEWLLYRYTAEFGRTVPRFEIDVQPIDQIQNEYIQSHNNMPIERDSNGRSEF
jgi:hypothetical protein